MFVSQFYKWATDENVSEDYVSFRLKPKWGLFGEVATYWGIIESEVPMKTPLCDLLDIEYPIIQGAMARITDGKFAAAVSNAGALGIIRCGFSTPENMREEIRICKSLLSRSYQRQE